MKTCCTVILLIMLLAGCFAAAADDPEKPQPAPPALKVELKLDRDEFLLGESIAVEYVMKNEGNKPARFIRESFYPDLRLSKEYRLSAFKIDENGKPTEKPQATWPMPLDMGGMRDAVGPFVQPGESHSATLFVTRYVRFDEPGRYLLRIENIDDFPKEMVYSAGETVVTLKEPTPEEARRVYEKMKQAPRKAFDDNRMKFLAGAADFETMYQPVYLPILLEFAKQGDLDALPSLEKAESLRANGLLVSVLVAALDKDNWQLAHECYLRLKPAVPFPNWYDKVNADNAKEDRERVERNWKPEFGPFLTRLARRLIKEVASQKDNVPDTARMTDAQSQELLEDIGYIYACVGTPEDFGDCLAAFNRSIELTKTLPLETHQYFRPRGSAFRFKYAIVRMYQRGAKPPMSPTHPGEMAAYAITLQTQSDFRPEGWKAEVMKWLKSGPPYLAEQILDCLPEPIPDEVLDYLPTLLADDYIDLQIAACHIAEKHPREAYRAPLEKILKTGKEKFLRKFAVDAARANGLDADYDDDAPFVDHPARKAAAKP